MEGSVTHLMNMKKSRKKEIHVYTGRFDISYETQSILFSSNATAVKISSGNMNIFWLIPSSSNIVIYRDYKKSSGFLYILLHFKKYLFVFLKG